MMVKYYKQTVYNNKNTPIIGIHGHSFFGVCYFQVSNSARLSGECKETMPLFSYVIGEVVLSTTAVFVLPTRRDRLVKLVAQTVEDYHTGSELILVYAGTSAGKILIVCI